MSKWSKATNKAKAEQSGDLTPHLTMNLRCVKHTDGSLSIEQLVEYRNNTNQLINSEWVTIPTVMEVSE